MAQAKKYSASEAAMRIGTDAKTLRRFLRDNDSYTNVGSGGRYSFTSKEVTSMAKAFTSWNSSRSKKIAPSSQTSAKTSKTTKRTETAAERKRRADARVDALEASLKKSGKHISQHQENVA